MYCYKKTLLHLSTLHSQPSINQGTRLHMKSNKGWLAAYTTPGYVLGCGWRAVALFLFHEFLVKYKSSGLQYLLTEEESLLTFPLPLSTNCIKWWWRK